MHPVGAAFSPWRRLYPPAWKPYGLEAEPEAGRDLWEPCIKMAELKLCATKKVTPKSFS